MCKLLLASLFLLGLACQADAASIYWSPNVTSGGGANCNNGTYAWDADSGTAGAAHKCWATTTGGATAAAIPGAGDSPTFDASSGGGTIAVNGNFSNGSLVLTGFTGTLDYSVNNNSPTLTGLSDSSGTHTLKMGSGTWALNTSATSGTILSISNAGLTLTAGTSVLNITSTGACTAGTITFNLGAKTFNTVSFTSSAGACLFNLVGANTFGTLTLTGPVFLGLPSGTTQTVSTALNLTGTAGNSATLISGTVGTTATLAAPASVPSATWAAIRDITFTTNSFAISNCTNLGHTTGVTCNAPSGGLPSFIGIIGGS